MTAFFLAPIYIIVNIYIFMRITGWLKTGFPVLGTRRGIVLSAAVYSFFAVSFLTAFLNGFQCIASITSLEEFVFSNEK